MRRHINANMFDHNVMKKWLDLGQVVRFHDMPGIRFVVERVGHHGGTTKCLVTFVSVTE